MPETAENVAADFGIERQAQDRMALASQRNAVAAQQAGHLAREICPVTIAQKKGEAIVVRQDEPPRDTSLDALAKLRGVVRPPATLTAANGQGPGATRPVLGADRRYRAQRSLRRAGPGGAARARNQGR